MKTAEKKLKNAGKRVEKARKIAVRAQGKGQNSGDCGDALTGQIDDRAARVGGLIGQVVTCAPAECSMK